MTEMQTCEECHAVRNINQILHCGLEDLRIKKPAKSQPLRKLPPDYIVWGKFQKGEFLPFFLNDVIV